MRGADTTFTHCFVFRERFINNNPRCGCFCFKVWYSLVHSVGGPGFNPRSKECNQEEYTTREVRRNNCQY